MSTEEALRIAMGDDDPGEVTPSVDPARLLCDVETFLGTFVAFPTEHARVAATLWTAHAHAVDAFESSPRLALLSPEPGSGKTRALEVLELVTPLPMHVLSASAAAIFRSIEKAVPTLLFDEVDAIFGRRGKDDGNEDLRALLNAGHRRGATIPRCVGPTHDVRRFPVYAAVALAGLGDLPDTLMSRSVVVRMRRRAPGENVRPFRHRLAAPEGHALRDRLAAWADAAQDGLRDVWPAMPDGVTDRPADVWEPLLAVADAAGGIWPERARAACVELTRANVARDASLGIRLLSDLRAIFGDEDRLSTETILERLCAVEEAPWADLRGRPIDARGLARRLGAFEICSTKVRIDDKSVRGYRREDLFDAWQRYCPATTPTGSGTSGTSGTAQVSGTFSGSVNGTGAGTSGTPPAQESSTGSGTVPANGTGGTPSEQGSSTGSGGSGPVKEETDDVAEAPTPRTGRRLLGPMPPWPTPGDEGTP
ncbi:hypothetical protein BH24ACT3_BH24ACT3_11470 [soil metagenome]